MAESASVSYVQSTVSDRIDSGEYTGRRNWINLPRCINSSDWTSCEWITSIEWTSLFHEREWINSSELIISSNWTNAGGWANSSEWINSETTTEPSLTDQRTFPPPPLYLFILKFTACTIFLLVSFLGNVLVLYAVATTRKLRSYNNYYLVALAVADLVSGGIVPALANINWLVQYWPFSEIFCTVVMLVKHIFLHATFLMTLIICFDRYRALYKPVQHMKERTLKHACVMISVGYLIPVLIWTPLIVVLPYTGVTERVLPPDCHGSYGLHPPLLIITVIVLSWIPIVATSVLYAFVYYAIVGRSRGKTQGGREAIRMNRFSGIRVNQYENHEGKPSSPSDTAPRSSESQTAPPPYANAANSSGKINMGYTDDGERSNFGTEVPPQEPDPKRHQNVAKPTSTARRQQHPPMSCRKTSLVNLRATRTVTYIWVVMVVSGLPWSVYALMTVIDLTSTEGVDAEMLSFIAHLSSAANPFCYAICNPLFKRAFERVLCCRRCRNSGTRQR